MEAMGAGGLAMLVYALSAAVTLGSVGGGVLMFTHRLARREGFVARVAALAGLVAVGALTGSAAAPALGEVVGTSYALQLALFSGMLALLVGAVTWLYETTAWTALFCCTAGYAMQNFASGLTELCWALAGVPETADASLGAHLTRFGINVTCILAVYVPFYLGFVRKISREALERIDNPALLAVMAAVMLGVIGFDLLIKCMGDFGLLTIWFMAPLRLFHGLMCVLTFALEYELLVNRHLQIEREAETRVHAERERQYELSRANIEAINIKCHDIKHQIRALAGGGTGADERALADLAHEVDFYDSAVHTGNEALDTILTEKRLTCANEGITLSCVADGAALGFMRDADIYSLFGNALDNAIEATRKLGDPSLRSISLVVRQAAGVASIHVENRYANEPLVGQDGSIASSKGDGANHGFGLRSMRLTVESYNGTLATLIDHQGRTFHVNAMIPLP